MRQGTSSRRARGRGNSRGGRQQNIRNQQMDSNGPGGRVRGTPQQILDRYLALARDASSAGDYVLAENLWQHAEHYTRMLNAAMPQQQQSQQNAGNNGYQNGRDEDYDDQDTSGDAPVPVEPLNLSSEPSSAEGDGNPSSDPAQEPQPGTPEAWNGQEQPQAETTTPAPRRRRRTRFPRQQEESAGEDNRAADASAETSSDRQANGAASAEDLPPLELPSIKEKAPATEGVEP